MSRPIILEVPSPGSQVCVFPRVCEALATTNSMELSKSPQDLPKPRESASEGKTLEASVSLFVRVWSYGGPSQPAIGLRLDQDGAISGIIQEIVREGNGRIAEQQAELCCAHFADAMHALSAARTLQQRFLTFHRKTDPQQVVPSILIYPTSAEEIAAVDAAVPADMLANITSAQILIAESIYVQAKDVPGFRFNAKAVRESGETFGAEAIYEMLWTDESTYGHLRQASRAGLRTVGRYHVQEELGRGAMGAVYKAYDELIGRTVALKTISIDRNAPKRDELIERLKQEAKAAGGLDHPNIITIYDVGQEDDVVYLSMQYVKGTTLASVLADVGVPSLATFLSWADQICGAVGFAHASGVIHRDLKPANLMVTEDGVIKVLDFGIAKIEDTSLTQTGLVVGTPSYMSPEQLAGKKVDQRADVFALGSVFYELVTRERPFQGDVTSILYKIVHEDPVAPSLINPAIPGGIDAVIRKALAKDPKERFQTCEEMRAAFADSAARLHVTPAAVGPTPMVAVKANLQHEPAAPSFLLTESAPKRRRNLWPIAFMTLFLGTAGWAYYVHATTGSYPDFLNKIVGASRNLPQAIRDGKAAPSAGQAQGNPAEQNAQSSKTNDADANNGSTPAESIPDATTGAVPQAAPANPAVAGPSSATPAEEGDSAASGGAGGDSNQATNEAAPTTGTAPASQSVTAVQPGPRATMPAGNMARSPFSPAAVDGQPTAEVLKKPARQPLLTVDGFTKKNIPELLRVADISAQRGDYRLAAYEYRLILKLDHDNVRARTGLRLIQESERLR
jgi:serine/threonine protein kinase